MNLTLTGSKDSVRRPSFFLSQYRSVIFGIRVSVFYLALLTFSMQVLLANSGNGQSIEDIKVTVGMRKGETLESLV